jgi:hypothetical protein
MLHETYAILAEALSDPTPCLPPGFSGPVSTALGWVKALSLVIGVVALVRIGVHILRQQGDGVIEQNKQGLIEIENVSSSAVKWMPDIDMDTVMLSIRAVPSFQSPPP